ncbi:glycosyltransferase [Tessaracoccus sp. HDW20]|nr:glycosyltransferase [Tessaracoccus coleopterorum]
MIVPVHNCGAQLEATLASIGAQTLDSLEIILIDDGSTDDSRAIMESFAKCDPRVRVVPGPATGSAGDARNAGLALAKGRYVSFLDGDDLFMPSLLETLSKRAETDMADVVACRYQTLNSLTGDTERADWMLRVELLPRSLPFAPQDVGDRLFFAFNSAAWNKLFNREFLLRKGVVFQSLKRTNDAYFTFLALALSQRISYVDEVLITYRVQQQSSLQATIAEDPFEFTQALAAIRDRLAHEGLLPTYQRAFTNLAISMSSSSLRRQNSAESFLRLYDALDLEVLDRFGLRGCLTSTSCAPTWQLYTGGSRHRTLQISSSKRAGRRLRRLEETPAKRVTSYVPLSPRRNLWRIGRPASRVLLLALAHSKRVAMFPSSSPCTTHSPTWRWRFRAPKSNQGSVARSFVSMMGRTMALVNCWTRCQLATRVCT